MIDLVKRLLGTGGAGDGAPGTAREKHRIPVATCALLLEMAQIDGEFSGEESRIVVSLMRDRYGLGEEETSSIMEAAREELVRSIDLWQFARIINYHYTEEEKVQILEMIWAVIYADGRLEKHEDHLVHSLGRLLRLDHSQLIEAKLKVKETMVRSSGEGKP